MMILVSFCLAIFFIFAAFAINVTHIQLSKAELRTAVDAAARAAARELAENASSQQVTAKAIDIASRNTVAGKPLALSPSNVTLGQSTVVNGRFVFTPNATPINSVKVFGDRASTNRIGSVFGGLLGMPTYGASECSTAVRADRDIMVVIDRSGSMMRRLDDLVAFPPGCDETTPPHPTMSRWAKLLAGYSIFLNVLDATDSIEHVGLTTYGSDSSQDLDLTSDYTATYNSLLERSSYAMIGMTNLGDGMADGLQNMFYGSGVRAYAAKTIVLLTDGRPNVGSDPIQRAHECKAANVVVHTITFGAFADETIMRQIADITGGDFYAAPDDATLQSAFEKIAKNVPILTVE
jgi:Flp pilus assembly protein TadG/uncharacterized protein YegL